MSTDSSTDALTEADLAELSAGLLEHLNNDHGDWVLTIARGRAGAVESTDAELVGLDLEGVLISVTGGATDGQTVKALFTGPITDLGRLQAQAVELAVAARAALGVDTLTSLEAERVGLSAIRTFLTTVVDRAEVATDVVKITFGGGDLATFTSLGFDQFLYVLAPRPTHTELTIDQSFTWEAWQEMPEHDRPIGAYYTVREWRPESHELDLYFVLHGDLAPSDEHGGWAASWARSARRGDPVALWGPRTAWEPPTTVSEYLLVADDTGAPAVAAIIDSLSVGTAVRAIVEVDDADHAIEMPVRDGVHVQWIHRRGAAPGTTSLLLDAVRERVPPGSSVGALYAWGGAESKTITAVRKYLRHDLGLARDQVSMTGYWRLGADDGIDDDD